MCLVCLNGLTLARTGNLALTASSGAVLPCLQLTGYLTCCIFCQVMNPRKSSTF